MLGRVQLAELECDLPSASIHSLQNTYTVCKSQEKLLRLLGILQSEALGESGDEGEPKKILVYFATCACVDYFYKVRLPPYTYTFLRVSKY